MAKKIIKKGGIGSSFEDFLKEEDMFESAQAHAIKQVLAWQIAREMQQQGLSKARMAERMKTSRSQLDRLLDPANDNVQLDTMQRAAHAVGKRITFMLEDAAPPTSRV
jgi:antitoxin HicB